MKFVNKVLVLVFTYYFQCKFLNVSNIRHMSCMVTTGVSFGGKTRLHFVDEKARVNVEYYLTNEIPKLTEDATALMPRGFLF